MQVLMYDESDKIMDRAWMQKLHIYFTLSPMIEEYIMQFSTLNLDGVAYD